jgi:NAD(P)H-nitrite reductase large subunit
MSQDDILEKGAIAQRDRKTFAVAPHVPGGFLDVAGFRKIVECAEKYNAKALKLTSGQRLAVIGVAPEEVDRFWQDVGRDVGYAIGLCVRMVKFCPGTTYCRFGKQDAMALGAELDRRYHGRPLSAKFKMAVAGCENACNAPAFKEIGFTGGCDGWDLAVGGTCGAKPRIADVIARNLSAEQALEMAERVVDWFDKGKFRSKVRMGRVIDEIGLDAFKKAIGL